ncbi:MAG: HEAT repeat domain-containing protein [Chitinivibrionales bacterium]|nr:HEAT repeat domain-containing protein [Chitinivibrionales bacterium]
MELWIHLKKVTRIRRNEVVLALLFFLLLSLAYTVARSSKYHDAFSIINSYKATSNPIERKNAVAAVSTIITTPAPQWSKEFLTKVLDDKDPHVVEEAVIQIGVLRINELSKKLIDLFNNCDQAYREYSQQVEYAIITSLGKIGGERSKEFLRQLLVDDDGSDLGQFILVAINDLNDRQLINEIQLYSEKMKKIVASATENNLDPIVCSRNRWYIQLSQDIEQSLRLRGIN